MPSTPAGPSSKAQDATAGRDHLSAGDAGRLLVADSWRRSLAAGVDPGLCSAPLVFDTDMISAVRQAHPLDRHLPMLRETLRGMADASEHLMVITDAGGHVL